MTKGISGDFLRLCIHYIKQADIGYNYQLSLQVVTC